MAALHLPETAFVGSRPVVALQAATKNTRGASLCGGIPSTSTFLPSAFPMLVSFGAFVLGAVRRNGRPPWNGARKRLCRAPVRARRGDEIKFATVESDAEESPALEMTAADCARALSSAMPSLSKLAGSVVVIKYGGAAMVTEPERTIRDVAMLRVLGLKPVLVHGGGPEINSWLTKLGIQPKFVKGLRVTDEETMKVVAMVLMGKVNKNIVATMGAAGVPAVGVSGVDGNLLHVRRSDDEVLGCVGEILDVNPSLLHAALDDGLVPVVSSVSASEGELLNVNADTAAAAIASALGASEFVIMTDVAGLLRDVDDPSSLISTLNPAEARALIDDVVVGGMIPKITCCLQALDTGVTSAHIVDGRRPHALLEKLCFQAGRGLGTTISREP